MNAEDPRGAATRSRLIAVTLELIAEEGLRAATTRAITRRAGVNVGAVNYHFGSKAALLRETVAAAVAESLEQVVPGGGDGGLPADTGALVATLRSARPLADSAAARVVLVAALEGSRDPDLAGLVRAKLDGLRAQTLAAIGGDPADEGVAELIAAALDGLLLHLLIDPEMDLDGCARALGRILAAS